MRINSQRLLISKNRRGAFKKSALFPIDAVLDSRQATVKTARILIVSVFVSSMVKLAVVETLD